MPATADDFQKVFSKLDASYAKDYAAIFNYLTKKAFQAEMPGAWKAILDNKMKSHFSGGLGENLTQLEANNKFTGPAKKIDMKIDGSGFEAIAKAFFGLFIDGTKGYPFIDAAALVKHGQLSHRIQWNIIMQAVVDKKLVLDNPVIDLYVHLGNPVTWSTANEFAVWDVIVDYNNPIRQKIKKLNIPALDVDELGNCPETIMGLVKDYK